MARVRSRRIEMVIQSVKDLNILRVGDLILCHKADHLAACHFAHGALFNDLTVLFLAEDAGDESNSFRKVLCDTDAVFLGGKIDNAARL